MSNSQRRTAQRHRTKRRPGPHDAAVKDAQEYVLRLGTQAHQKVVQLREAALTEERRTKNAERAIPVSGSARRRAKAERNRTKGEVDDHADRIGG